MELPSDWLDRYVEEGARLLLTHFLDEAAAAAPRLRDESDSEALHDFRVAMRRFRSADRAFRPWLETSVSRKQRKRVRRLVDATGVGRDAEVLLDRLKPLRSELSARQRVGYEWLVADLEQRRVNGYAVVRKDVTPDFEDIEKRLRKELSAYRLDVTIGGANDRRTLGSVYSELLRSHRLDLIARIRGIRGPADVEGAHAARISAKRLRYLIEPLRGFVPHAKEAARAPKELQELLGDLHDYHVLSLDVVNAHERAAAERARAFHPQDFAAALEGKGKKLSRDERPGLLSVARAANEHATALWQRVESEWRIDPEARLQGALAAAEALDTVPTSALEIERKYLLRGLPDAARERGEVLAIDQGYLPGRDLLERIRRVEGRGSTKYYRTVKLGAGVQRIEIEEETTPEIFHALWALTENRRVRKRRWVVAHEDLTWEIDEFLDRDLVLAEVELASADVAPALPPWLAPLVVREVTEEPAYVNANLAR